ncbi:beta/gamma crystallin domain-containing protein [Nocardia transvalensis]|uniref:beta/gamma crystallin domain-containing protein n=1 Tax=Nocardia transvalensis TaxID=37333 RepID=UPI001894AF7B|nr:beta/gamma crystallin domain-containing protein [Nocardia transvalensis]MBF6334111.1 hypothetical protein [Nocardia transvalensis]
MSVDEATFYRNVNYAGEPYSYKLGTQESLPGELNDQFRSVRTGELVKVTHERAGNNRFTFHLTATR